jgi:hypothetical protein
MTIEQKKKEIRKAKIFQLHNALHLALVEKRINQIETDTYELASQYSRTLQKSDFDLIKNMTIDEIVEELK